MAGETTEGRWLSRVYSREVDMPIEQVARRLAGVTAKWSPITGSGWTDDHIQFLGKVGHTKFRIQRVRMFGGSSCPELLGELVALEPHKTYVLARVGLTLGDWFVIALSVCFAALLSLVSIVTASPHFLIVACCIAAVTLIVRRVFLREVRLAAEQLDALLPVTAADGPPRTF